jgi:UDP-N-acetylglucosamine 3-dehydrogenase
MADRLRVAVIGAGVMGANHIRVYNELSEVELVAVADTNDDALPASGLRAYRDYRRLLDEEQPEAVSIAVPARAHHEVALACIERRLAVLVEKPIAASVEQGEELRAASERNDAPLMVGHVERFNPAVCELKRRLDDGQLGRVYQARARRVGPFFRRERDVGVVYDLATHDIDVLHFLLGSEVERVQAETQRGIRTEFEDVLAGVLRFENGAVAQLEASWITPIKQRELVLLGERGMFALDYIRRTLVFYPHADDAEGKGESIAIPDAEIEPLRAELAAFVRVAQRLEPPAITAADGIAALRVAEALVEAGRTGRSVRVAEGRPAK